MDTHKRLLVIASLAMAFAIPSVSEAQGFRNPVKAIKNAAKGVSDAAKKAEEDARRAAERAAEQARKSALAKAAAKAAEDAKRAAAKAAADAKKAAAIKAAAKALEDAKKAAAKAAEDAKKAAQKAAMDAARADVAGKVSSALKDAEKAAKKAVDDIENAAEIAGKDISNSWKVNGGNLSKEWKQFLDYLDGIWKTIYEQDIHLTEKTPDVTILDVREHQHVRIEVFHVEGAAVLIDTWDARTDKKSSVNHELQAGRFADRVNLPEIRVRLKDPKSEAVVRVKCTERRGTFEDLGGAGSTLDPDDTPRKKALSKPTREATDKEIEIIVEDAEQNGSAGWYYYIETEHEEDPGSWFGPYATEAEALRSYNDDLAIYAEWFGEVVDTVEPTFYKKSPDVE